MSARRALLDLGFVVIEAEHGAEAMAILEQTPGIALLLTDVVMPGLIDDRALAAFARDQRGVPQVVLMSGYAPQSGVVHRSAAARQALYPGAV